MTLSLKETWTSFPLIFLYPFLAVFIVALAIKSCNRQPEEPIYTKLARMDERIGGFLQYDTTKPQPKPINHTYSLAGSDTLFNILWTQIVSPEDVTPRQKIALQNWIQKDLKPDTTNLK